MSSIKLQKMVSGVLLRIYFVNIKEPSDIPLQNRVSALHIAFASKHEAFIKEVVRILAVEDLEQRNIDGDTALCFAAKLGIVTIAEEMVNMNNRLPLIRSSEGRTPLCIAVLFGHRDMARYLCTVTCLGSLKSNEFKEILVATITYDMYGMSHISIIL